MSDPHNRSHLPDWRNQSSYAYTGRLTRLGWAWEFLRRNPLFQRELAHALERVDYVDRSPNIDVIASPVDLSAWGVMFR